MEKITTNQPSHRPSLSVSLAEEIASELYGHRLLNTDWPKPAEAFSDATAIIQRRVEPLERERDEMADLLRASSSEIENLREKLRLKEDEGWEGSKRRFLLAERTKQALARIKEGR